MESRETLQERESERGKTMSNDLGGVWRTVKGRRIFIKDGQSLTDAMKESGKYKDAFDRAKTGEVQVAKGTTAVTYIGQDGEKHILMSYEYPKDSEEYEKFLKRKYGTDKEEEIKDSNGKTDYKKLRNEFYEHQEYELYKRAKENPDSIDPMTENSTDWEALDKKYSQKYEYEKRSIEANKPEGQKTVDLLKGTRSFADDIKDMEAKEQKYSAMSKKELATLLVEDQIKRGVVKPENKQRQILARLNGSMKMSKEDLVKYCTRYF